MKLPQSIHNAWAKVKAYARATGGEIALELTDANPRFAAVVTFLIGLGIGLWAG